MIAEVDEPRPRDAQGLSSAPRVLCSRKRRVGSSHADRVQRHRHRKFRDWKGRAWARMTAWSKLRHPEIRQGGSVEDGSVAKLFGLAVTPAGSKGPGPCRPWLGSVGVNLLGSCWQGVWRAGKRLKPCHASSRQAALLHRPWPPGCCWEPGRLASSTASCALASLPGVGPCAALSSAAPWGGFFGPLWPGFLVGLAPGLLGRLAAFSRRGLGSLFRPEIAPPSALPAPRPRVWPPRQWRAPPRPCVGLEPPQPRRFLGPPRSSSAALSRSVCSAA